MGSGSPVLEKSQQSILLFKHLSNPTGIICEGILTLLVVRFIIFMIPSLKTLNG